MNSHLPFGITPAIIHRFLSQTFCHTKKFLVDIWRDQDGQSAHLFAGDHHDLALMSYFIDGPYVTVVFYPEMFERDPAAGYQMANEVLTRLQIGKIAERQPGHAAIIELCDGARVIHDYEQSLGVQVEKRSDDARRINRIFQPQQIDSHQPVAV